MKEQAVLESNRNSLKSIGVFWQETWWMVRKDFVLEWREKSSINSILLYVSSTVFVCYLSFGQRKIDLSPITWNTLWWIILLFAAFNSISKSFLQEKESRFYFYYTLTSPQVIITAKIIYNSFLMLVTTIAGFLMYSLVMGNPVEDLLLFSLNMGLAAIGFSAALTTIAGIASKAGNSATLMAILGFPVVLPMILMLIKVAKNAMDGLAWSASADEILTIFAINMIVLAVSYILFPFLWRT